MQNNKKPQQIKKHVAAIHCANSLGLLQRKISNALLYHAYHELLESETHQISMSYLCKLIGYAGKNVQKIKDAIRALVSTTIEWNLINECGEEDWTACSMLAGARIKSGQCYYSYYIGLRELLHSPSVYGRINLIVQARFSSTYGLALYENCARYVGIPQTKEFQIDTFRKLMGVADNQYLIFRDFKRRVLDKAVSEVNSHSDIHIEPIVKRVGRKVVAIQFKLEIRNKRKRINIENVNYQQKLDKREVELFNIITTDFGIGNKQAHNVIKECGIDRVEQQLNVVMSSTLFKAGKIKNMAGYLIEAIKNNYQMKVSSAELATKRRVETDLLKEQQERNELYRKKIIRAHEEHTDRELFEQLKRLPLEEEQRILEDFSDTLPIIILKKYEKEGFNNLVAKALFKCFVIEKYSNKFNFINIDKFTSFYEESG